MQALGTYLGTLLGTDLGTFDDDATELAALELYLAQNLFSWMRPAVGQSVASFADRVAPGVGARAIDANHAFVQATPANQVAAIAKNALMANREVALFAGSQNYASTLAPASWKTHDGTGWAQWFAYYPTSSALGVYTGNNGGTGAPFMFWYQNGGTTAFDIENDTGSIASDPGHGALVTNTPTYRELTYIEGAAPEYSLYNKSVLIASGNSASAPTSTVASATMQIGQRGDGSFKLNGAVADVLFAKVNATSIITLRAAVQRYLRLRYFL